VGVEKVNYVQKKVAVQCSMQPFEKMNKFSYCICRYKDKTVMHPFAFRTHTHSLGVRVLGYRVRNGTWTLLGEKSPQIPQAFYPVKDKNMTLKKGDWLVRFSCPCPCFQF